MVGHGEAGGDKSQMKTWKGRHWDDKDKSGLTYARTVFLGKSHG